MNTKFTEETLTTSDLTKMRSMYLSERLLRKWKENFVDEDTSEVIEIERSELILERGTYLGQSQISEINFMLQSGDITEVKISNQQRSCNPIKSHTQVWSATVQVNSKKKNFYLYANSVELAKDITEDFISQKYSGVFRVVALRELDFSHLIAEEINEDDFSEKEEFFYKIEIELTSDDVENYNQSFILKSTDAENAKEHIISYLSRKRIEEGDSSDFEVVIISAKTISCEEVIEYSFTEQYYEHSKES